MTPRCSALGAAVLLSTFLAAGCASRRTTANVPQPPPAPPSATPPATAEAAKRDTSVPPPPARRSKTPPTPAPAGYTEEGNASWYGNEFQGRRSSNGEIFDTHKLTAAHRTLPFDTMVHVTNLNNGKSTTVRITDRGPFVANRIIDLSLAAAREIESVGPGVVPVRIEVLGNVDVNTGFFTVQVGAFQDRGNAERLRERLSLTYSPIFIQQIATANGAFYRVRVGKVSGAEAAASLAGELHEKEGFVTLLFRLDDATPSGAN